MRFAISNTKGKLLKLGQAAELLRVSPQTVRDWTENGKLTAHQNIGSTHRQYFEADVMKTLLQEKGQSTYWTATLIVAIDANGKVYHFNPETYEPGNNIEVDEMPFNRFWNFDNGLQQLSHTAALNSQATIVPPSRSQEAYIIENEEGENLIGITATTVGLDRKECVELLASAIRFNLAWLKENFTPNPTIVWMDKSGKQIKQV